MAKGTRAFVPGLEGVPVAETVLSWVDGEKGRLVIAGRDVEDVALTATFEEASALLLAGDDAPPTAGDVKAAFGAAREAAHERLPELGAALDAPDAMDALRAAMAHLSEDRRPGVPPFLAAAKLVGAAPVFAAAWARKREGLPPVKPDRAASHAADFLRILRGAAATEEEVRALDTYLVTVVDHGLNASTFAARVVASTGSDLVSAVTAAISALKGPLHGGAPGPVLDMLDSVGDPSRAAEWLGSELDARRRIMGMGHRVYRTRDPRAAVLEVAVERLHRALSAGRAESPAARRLELARAVEREATSLLAARHPNRALRANVEFYTAVLLEALGVPRELFSAVFAVARTVGWTAHVEEERRKGRLIRPTSIYVGPVPDSRHSTKSRSLP
ncbi:MAG TPA: citrate synthase [Polyangiaceae bacterium]|nr:citrate synthase [Polyangiaceae bacterium]